MENLTGLGGTLPTDRQYTDQRREAALGKPSVTANDYKARFYSPRLGRFLSADTLVPGVGSQHLSRYMYVTGNSLRYTDPTGHCLAEGDRDRCIGIVYLRYLNTFQRPYTGNKRVTQGYDTPGHRPPGQDLAGAFSVHAPSGGVVIKAGRDGIQGVWQFGKLANDDEKKSGTARERKDRNNNTVWVSEVSGSIIWRTGKDKERIDAYEADPNWVELCPECSHKPGNQLVIDHGNGIRTVYYHVDIDEQIHIGLDVSKGQSLGKSANIGWSYGAHLHFSVQIDGIWVDPGVTQLVPRSTPSPKQWYRQPIE